MNDYEYANARDVAPDVLRVIGTAHDRPARQVTLCRQPGEEDASFCGRAQREAKYVQNYFYGVGKTLYASVVIHCLYDVAPDPARFDDDRDNSIHCLWWCVTSPRAPAKASRTALHALQNVYGLHGRREGTCALPPLH